MRRYVKRAKLADLVLVTLAALASHWAATTMFLMYQYWVSSGWTWNWSEPPQVLTCLALILLIKWRRYQRIHWDAALLALAGVEATQLLGFSAHELRHGVDARLLSLAGFCLAVVVITYFVFVKRVKAEVATISQDGWEPQDGLVLFLSVVSESRGSGVPPLKPDTHLMQKSDDRWVEGGENPDWIGLRERLLAVTETMDSDFSKRPWLANTNWVMPVVAIQRHLRDALPSAGKRALRVAVIASTDTKPERADGSYRQFEVFRQLLLKLCGSQDTMLTVERVAKADFTDSAAIAKAVVRAKKWMEENRVDRYYIDVTSGTAMCSVVGAALMLEDGERFEYVSNARDVRAYDLIYHRESYGGE